MPHNFNNLEFIMGSAELLKQQPKPRPPFAAEIIEFLDALSKKLMATQSIKEYPDIATFAFWCRKASIMEQKTQHSTNFRLGRGYAFHIAPSNVAVNFAYSLVAGLLAGNANIVRLPSKKFLQVDIICSALKAVCYDMPDMQNYIILVKYGHEKEINDFLSSICNIRIIWGGDISINTIRSSPLPPRTTEITFADRYSLAIIDADQYLLAEDKENIALKFYNDTYLTDQNACSSPKIVIWRGRNVAQAQKLFWNLLEKLLIKSYDLQPTQAVNKLLMFCKYSSVHSTHLITQSNNIFRVNTEKLEPELSKYFQNSGYFYEYIIKQALDEIIPLCGLNCQTIAYYGINKKELYTLLEAKNALGVDRIVEIGHTMDFSLIWDGYDLIYQMSRKII